MIRRYLGAVKIAERRSAPPRRVLGIDPGTNVLGFGLVEQRAGKRYLIHFGVHKTRPTDVHAEKLRSIFACISDLIVQLKPSECALESPFFGKNVQSMLKLGRAQGVAMAAAMAGGLTVTEYAPKKIKLSVTGSGNASKEQVAEMCAQLLSFSRDGIPLDATDAIATALTHLNQTAVGGVMSGGAYSGWKHFLERNPGRLS